MFNTINIKVISVRSFGQNLKYILKIILQSLVCCKHDECYQWEWNDLKEWKIEMKMDLWNDEKYGSPFQC